ncbi:MAG: ArsR family transcriptional regulator, partial [Candidatus Heimdallarchaeaceae archaeon]
GRPPRKHILLSKEEIARAREEIKRAKEELRRERERMRLEARRKALESAKKSDVKPFIFSKNIDLDGFGETISKYVESILASVSRNIEETVKSAFSTEKSSTGRISGSNFPTSNKKASKFSFPYDYRRIPIDEIESYLDEISELLSAIGDKNRLHILKLLELQPEYQKELSEKTGLRGGTFKHHTDILAKNGLITQETVRGRYLITQLGIEALKLAEILYTRKQDLYSSEDSLDDEDDDEINIDIN